MDRVAMTWVRCFGRLAAEMAVWCLILLCTVLKRRENTSGMDTNDFMAIIRWVGKVEQSVQ